jgi:hypothetical protein
MVTRNRVVSELSAQECTTFVYWLEKYKAKLSPCISNEAQRHEDRRGGGREMHIKIHVLLTATLVGGECSASLLRPLYPHIIFWM